MMTTITGVLQVQNQFNWIGLKYFCVGADIKYLNTDDNTQNILDYLVRVVKLLELRSRRKTSFMYRDQRYILPLERIWIGFLELRDKSTESVPHLVFSVKICNDGTFSGVRIRATDWAAVQEQYRRIVTTSNWSGLGKRVTEEVEQKEESGVIIEELDE